MAEFYAADADFVGIDGDVIKGRDAIVGMYEQVFDLLPGNQAKLILSSRRFISPDIIVDDGMWEVIGVLPEGAPKQGLATTVFQKQESQWQIVCARTMVPVIRTALNG